jgi:excisionase family DNA binding protein
VETEWLTVQEVAVRLRTTKTSVGKMIRAGMLPAVYLSQRAGWRIKASDVEALTTVHQRKEQEEHRG